MNIFQDLFQKIMVIVTSIVVGVTGVFTGQATTSSPSSSPVVISEPSSTPLPTPLTSPAGIATKSASETKKIKNTPKSQRAFTRDQYDVIVSNLSYETRDMVSGSDFKNDYVKADITIKNISIEPFITGYVGSGDPKSTCQIEKDGQLTNFKIGSFFHETFQKAILPGESVTMRFETWFVTSGEYDSQGNLVKPPPGLKIKSCILTVKTKDNANIEPRVVNFPN